MKPEFSNVLRTTGSDEFILASKRDLRMEFQWKYLTGSTSYSKAQYVVALKGLNEIICFEIDFKDFEILIRIRHPSLQSCHSRRRVNRHRQIRKKHQHRCHSWSRTQLKQVGLNGF